MDKCIFVDWLDKGDPIVNCTHRMLQGGYLRATLPVPDDSPSVAPPAVDNLVAVVSVPPSVTEGQMNVTFGFPWIKKIIFLENIFIYSNQVRRPVCRVKGYSNP